MIEPIVILNEELIWSDSRELMGGGAGRVARRLLRRDLGFSLLEEWPYRMVGLRGCRKVRKNLDGTGQG